MPRHSKGVKKKSREYGMFYKINKSLFYYILKILLRVKAEGLERCAALSVRAPLLIAELGVGQKRSPIDTKQHPVISTEKSFQFSQVFALDKWTSSLGFSSTPRYCVQVRIGLRLELMALRGGLGGGGARRGDRADVLEGDTGRVLGRMRPRPQQLGAETGGRGSNPGGPAARTCTPAGSPLMPRSGNGFWSRGATVIPRIPWSLRWCTCTVPSR